MNEYLTSINIGSMIPIWRTFDKKIEMVQAVNTPFFDGDKRQFSIQFKNHLGYKFFAYYNEQNSFFEWHMNFVKDVHRRK